MRGIWPGSLLGVLLLTGMAWSLPENGQVVSGSIQMQQPGGHILQILQSSPSGIINWGSFSIGPQQLVQFLQPNSGSTLLNRVVGQDPSQILGQLQANGRIVLVNPNGMLFGPGSQVNAGSFLATTLSLSDQDFLQGRYDLRWDGQSPLRAIVNQGEIRVTEGGFLALISPLIDNQGLLVAERGQVVLGATRQATLSVDPRGLLQVSIPDGFAAHGVPGGAPQPVLLTSGQMTDTLASLIRPPGSEGQRLVETAQGLQLVGGEGLLVNQGQIQVDAQQGQAGSILLDSSQATVLAPGSSVSASSGQGDAGQILALSRGATLQMGQLEARSESAGDGGFIEVSGNRVHLSQGPDVSAPQGRPGTFLLDPDNLTVVSSGGSNTPPVIFTDPGTDLTVDASALNITGTVVLQANQNLAIDNGVQVHIDRDTQLDFDAGNNFEMRPGSLINATHPNASVSINATQTAFVTDLQVPTSHINAGRLEFLGGRLGQSGSDTLVNATAGSIFVPALTTVDVVGLNHARVALQATQDVVLGAGSQFHLDVPLGNLSWSGDTTGVTLLDQSILSSSGAANFTLSSATAGVFLQNSASLNAAGPSRLTLISPVEVFLGPNATLDAPDPGSVANISAGGQLTLGNLRVPTSHLNSTQVVQVNNTTLGVPGSPTLMNVSANGVAVFAGSTVNVLGSSADLNWQSAQDIFVGENSTLNVQAPTANLNLTANTGIFVGANARVQTGAANLSLVTTGQDILIREGAALNLAGPGNVSLRAPAGRVQMNDTSTINATDPSLGVEIQAGTSASIANLRVATSHLSAGQDLDFQNSSLGLAGANTLVNVTANSISQSPNQTSQFQGNQVNVALNATQRVNFSQGSSWQMGGGVANISLSGGNVAMAPDSGILSSHPASHVAINATADATVAGIEVPTTNLQASNLALESGRLGVSGLPGVFNATVNQDVVFLPNSQVTLQGSQNTMSLQAGRHILTGQGANLTILGEPNALTWSAGNLVIANANTTLQGDGATRFQITAGQQAALLTNTTLRLPNASSNVTVDSVGTIFLHRVQSGGSLRATATAGNIRITDQLSASSLELFTPQELISFQNTTQPALVASQSLNITAGRISGPVDDAGRDITKAFPFSTGPNARVRLNVTGTNSIDTGNRAANLYYTFPQSPDLGLDNPNGEVKVFLEPGPANPTVVESPSQVIDSRQDLTPEQQAEITQVAAQSQIQLSNHYTSNLLPTTSDVVMLSSDNAGLTSGVYMPLTSALVELVVLSPESSSRNLERAERLLPGPHATSLIVAGNDEDSELRYWRRLIEGFIIWEDD